jgi:hypothetical protein
MAIDSTIPIRQETIKLAAADAGLTAEVPAASIYGQTVPADRTFPFIRSGAPDVLPLTAACVDGSANTFTMHGFAKDRIVDGETVETAEDHAGRIGSLLASSLHGKLITLPRGSARIKWTGSQLLMDPDEPGCFHTIQNFSVRALTA